MLLEDDLHNTLLSIYNLSDECTIETSAQERHQARFTNTGVCMSVSLPQIDISSQFPVLIYGMARQRMWDGFMKSRCVLIQASEDYTPKTCEYNMVFVLIMQDFPSL